MTRFVVLAFSVLLFSFSVVSHAEIYKWVDENGKTHFGEKPPKSKQAEKVKIKSSAGIGGTNKEQIEAAYKECIARLGVDGYQTCAEQKMQRYDSLPAKQPEWMKENAKAREREIRRCKKNAKRFNIKNPDCESIIVTR